MEDKIEDLLAKKRDFTGVNVSLKSKFDTLKKFEKDIYDKVVSLDEKSNIKISQLENDFLKVNKDRLDLETNCRLDELNTKNEFTDHQTLEFNMRKEEKIEAFKIEDFNNQQNFTEEAIKRKIKEFEDNTTLINEMDKRTAEEPVYKIELEKNGKNKKKVEALEEDIMRLQTEVEELDQINEYLIQKKERIIQDRKKLLQLNEDLKREIESKKQLNDARIQKKVKDNNSDEIQKLETHSTQMLNNIREYEQKLELEIQKSREFIIEIIRLTIELRDRNEQRTIIVESVDQKLRDVADLKAELVEFITKHNQIREKVTNQMNENVQLKNRNKLLNEEFSSTMAKYNYIANNYDYTSNLKKISMEELKTLTQTNMLVNESIGHFVNKIGSFKKQNLKNIFEDF